MILGFSYRSLSTKHTVVVRKKAIPRDSRASRADGPGALLSRRSFSKTHCVRKVQVARVGLRQDLTHPGCSPAIGAGGLFAWQAGSIILARQTGYRGRIKRVAWHDNESSVARYRT